MEVFWLEQTEVEVPEGVRWLSDGEFTRLQAMRVPKRRTDWLLGRWTAKNALSMCLGLPTKSQTFREIEIRPAPSGAPEVFFRNEPAGVTISLSHRAGTGACAVALSHIALGCDLEAIEPHSDAFAADYFTGEEQALVAKAVTEDRSLLLTLLWSAKESALKAIHQGLRLDTRSVIVSFPGLPEINSKNDPFSKQTLPHSVLCLSGYHTWNPLQVRAANGQVFHGWGSEAGGFVRTMLASPAPKAPVLLEQKCLLAY